VDVAVGIGVTLGIGVAVRSTWVDVGVAAGNG